jgi:hypothetical protein
MYKSLSGMPSSLRSAGEAALLVHLEKLQHLDLPAQAKAIIDDMPDSDAKLTTFLAAVTELKLSVGVVSTMIGVLRQAKSSGRTMAEAALLVHLEKLQHLDLPAQAKAIIDGMPDSDAKLTTFLAAVTELKLSAVVVSTMIGVLRQAKSSGRTMAEAALLVHLEKLQHLDLPAQAKAIIDGMPDSDAKLTTFLAAVTELKLSAVVVSTMIGVLRQAKSSGRTMAEAALLVHLAKLVIKPTSYKTHGKYVGLAMKKSVGKTKGKGTSESQKLRNRASIGKVITCVDSCKSSFTSDSGHAKANFEKHLVLSPDCCALIRDHVEKNEGAWAKRRKWLPDL